MMITYTQEELSSIVHAFAFPGTITDWTPHGNGHINDTFLIINRDAGEEKRYILQRMNHEIFKDPVSLMKNVEGVTSFLREKIIANGGDPYRENLNLVRTKDGGAYYIISAEKNHSRRRRSIPRDAEPDSDDRRCLVFRR